METSPVRDGGTFSLSTEAAEFVVCKFTKAGCNVHRMIYKLFIMKLTYHKRATHTYIAHILLNIPNKLKYYHSRNSAAIQ